MFKHRTTFILLLMLLRSTSAFCQASHQVKTVAGTVVNVDAVGNIITVQTTDQKQMAFSVLEKANVTQQANDIGLMDIRATDPVTVQYYTLSPGKYRACWRRVAALVRSAEGSGRSGGSSVPLRGIGCAP